MADKDATLVLLNPVGMDGDCWQFLGFPQAKPFHYPGHGGRKRQPGWTFDQMADEVVAEFKGPLDLLGISMGGSLVARLLTKYPDRVRSAVIACSGGVGRAAGDLASRLKSANERAEPARKGGMAAAVEANLPRWFTPYAVRTEHPGVAYARKTLLAMDPEAWVDIWLAQANSTPIPEASMRAIKQPVTLVAGMRDAASGVAGLADLHQMIPNSRFEIVPAPHMIHLERPVTLASAMDRHFIWRPMGQRVEAPLGSTGE